VNYFLKRCLIVLLTTLALSGCSDGSDNHPTPVKDKAPEPVVLAVSDPGFGLVQVPGGTAEYSGLAHARDELYYAVADRTHDVFQIDITVNADTGEVTSVSIEDEGLVLQDAVDTEAIRYLPNGKVLVGDENGNSRPAIREYSLVDGSVLSSMGRNQQPIAVSCCGWCIL